MDVLTELTCRKTDLQPLIDEGVIVLKDQITSQMIQLLRSEIALIQKKVLAKIADLPRPIRTYSDIAERHLGRLDFKCGFTSTIFAEVAAPLVKLINVASPLIDFRHYWGAIPSLGGAGSTNMHRDIYPILNSTEGMNQGSLDRDLPPYYFTILIPLVELTPDNGPTEFIKGSHRQLIVEENTADIFAPLASPGDLIIFDGRTMHRGAANKTQDERLIAYMTFIAKWYHDQTFTINDYLFPELSLRGS